MEGWKVRISDLKFQISKEKQIGQVGLVGRIGHVGGARLLRRFPLRQGLRRDRSLRVRGTGFPLPWGWLTPLRGNDLLEMSNIKYPMMNVEVNYAVAGPAEWQRVTP